MRNFDFKRYTPRPKKRLRASLNVFSASIMTHLVKKYLKCHWDQNFGIPYFCIFENSLWLLVTMPNFNSLRRLEVAFFGRFLSRFYGRHYRPLFRKLACELAEVTLEAHLEPSQASFRGKFNYRRGKISCQLFDVRPRNFRCCGSDEGYKLVLYNATTINPTTELVFRFTKALREDPQWKNG